MKRIRRPSTKLGIYLWVVKGLPGRVFEFPRLVLHSLSMALTSVRADRASFVYTNVGRASIRDPLRGLRGNR